MEVKLDTDSIFFEDLLYSASRYAIGRHTGIGSDLIKGVYRYFSKAMSDEQRKNYAHNMRGIMLNECLRLSFHWTFDSDFSQEEVESISLISLVLDALDEGHSFFNIEKAVARHKDGKVVVDITYKEVGPLDASIFQDGIALADFIVWDDILKIMAGDTFIAICDSGAVAYNEEAVWSYMPIIKDGVATEFMKRVVRPVDGYSSDKFIPNEFIKGINYDKKELEEN